MQLFHSYTYTHTQRLPRSSLMTHLSSALALLWELERGGEDYSSRLQLKCQSDLHGVAWRPERSTFTTLLSSQAQSLCSLSFSPLNSPVCSAALTSLQESHRGALSPTMSPSTMPHCSHPEQEDHGLLSPLLRVVLVFAASIMLLCIYAAIMWITALFLQIHLKISSLLR